MIDRERERDKEIKDDNSTTGKQFPPIIREKREKRKGNRGTTIIGLFYCKECREIFRLK